MGEAEQKLKVLDSELEKITLDPRRRERTDTAIEHVILSIETQLKGFKKTIFGLWVEALKAQYVEAIQTQVANSAHERALAAVL